VVTPPLAGAELPLVDDGGASATDVFGWLGDLLGL